MLVVEKGVWRACFAGTISHWNGCSPHAPAHQGRRPDVCLPVRSPATSVAALSASSGRICIRHDPQNQTRLERMVSSFHVWHVGQLYFWDLAFVLQAAEGLRLLNGTTLHSHNHSSAKPVCIHSRHLLNPSAYGDGPLLHALATALSKHGAALSGTPCTDCMATVDANAHAPKCGAGVGAYLTFTKATHAVALAMRARCQDKRRGGDIGRETTYHKRMRPQVLIIQRPAPRNVIVHSAPNINVNTITKPNHKSIPP